MSMKNFYLASIMSTYVIFFQNITYWTRQKQTGMVFLSLRVKQWHRKLTRIISNTLGSIMNPVLDMEIEAICDIPTFPRTILRKGKHASENVAETSVLGFRVGWLILSYNLASLIPPAAFLVSVCQLACSCCWLVIQDWQCVLEKQNTKLHRFSKYMWKTKEK